MKKLQKFKTSIFYLFLMVFAISITSCSSDDDGDDSPQLQEASFTYAFNNGQVGEGTAYMGPHNRNLMATVDFKETSSGTDITVTLTNTVAGEMYMVHAHDAADPSTTPNGTPYDESPNDEVLNLMIHSNGNTASHTFNSDKDFDWLINVYEGFFVVHDPLQELSTTDLSTYLVVGFFAQDMPSTDPPVKMKTVTYAFNNGQVGEGTAYIGPHNRDLMATVEFVETSSGTEITVTLTNTEAGQMYMVHAHDAADPSMTPNGTPYDESPNDEVLNLMIHSHGNSASETFNTDQDFEWLVNEYEGFFVVHDPLQDLSTTDLATYLVVGIFGQDMPVADFPSRMMSFDYAFNNGQVGDGTAYMGPHNRDLTATVEFTETPTGTDVTVRLTNTVSGEMYMVHAHDAADPATTPNGTPYDEAPNDEVLNIMVHGNGGSVSQTFSSEMRFDWVINDYEGFFVVHDPLQDISTTDLSTYLVVGIFAQDMPPTDPPFRMMSYEYSFNTGQVGDGTAYNGPHNSDLMAVLTITEVSSMESMVSVTLTNTVSGEMYMVHAHDAADPATTPNGTPYIESPNDDVLNLMIHGTGDNAMGSMMSPMSFDELTGSYEGFFVVHDPLQPISTTDLTTYLVVGLFAN